MSQLLTSCPKRPWKILAKYGGHCVEKSLAPKSKYGDIPEPGSINCLGHERESGLLLVMQGTNKTKRAAPSWSVPKNSLVTTGYYFVHIVPM